MKFTIKTTEMKSACAIAIKAVSARSTLPFMQCIRLTAKDGNLELAATNYEVGIKTNIPASIEEEGEVLINGLLLQKIINNNQDEEVSFSLEKVEVVVQSKTMKFSMPIPEGIFTFPEVVDLKKKITFKGEDFKEAVYKASFSTKPDVGGSPMMSSYHIETDKDLVCFRTTDGFKMSETRCSLNKGTGNHQIIIPSKTILDVSRIVPDDAELEMLFGDNQAMFRFNETIVTTRVMDGKPFRTIPVNGDIKITVNRLDLLNVLRNAILVEFASTKTYPLLVQAGGNKLSVSYQGSKAKYAAALQIDHDGEDILFGIDPHFLSDFLKIADEEEFVTFIMAGPTSPIFIEGKAYTYALMPRIIR